LPKYYFDLGIPTERIGGMIGIFAFAGALGTLAGGFLGDRFSRRAILFLSPILCVPFMWSMLHSSGALFVISSVLAGFFVSMPHSIILVLSQEIAGNRRGLVGGLVLGFMFASGSTVAWLASIAADSVGLEAVLSFLAVLPLSAGFISLLLPTRGRVVEPASVASVPLMNEPMDDPFAIETPMIVQSASPSAD
jgi:FSR family fosmidomycin resistance protein-like MFS transporter